MPVETGGLDEYDEAGLELVTVAPEPLRTSSLRSRAAWGPIPVAVTVKSVVQRRSMAKTSVSLRVLITPLTAYDACTPSAFAV